MEAIKFEYRPSEYVIRIDRSKMSERNFDKFAKWLELEMLVTELDFDDSITKLHEEKTEYSWWENNKHRFINND